MPHSCIGILILCAVFLFPIDTMLFFATEFPVQEATDAAFFTVVKNWLLASKRSGIQQNHFSEAERANYVYSKTELNEKIES
jgi:hypothetical protein